MSAILDKLREVKKALAGATAAVVLLQAADQSFIPRSWLGAGAVLIAAVGAFVAVYIPDNEPA